MLRNPGQNWARMTTLFHQVGLIWCLSACSLPYYFYDLSGQARTDPEGEKNVPRLVIVIAVVVIIITIIVVVVTIYLVRTHRRRKPTQVQTKPVEAQEEVSVWDCESASFNLTSLTDKSVQGRSKDEEQFATTLQLQSVI